MLSCSVLYSDKLSAWTLKLCAKASVSLLLILLVWTVNMRCDPGPSDWDGVKPTNKGSEKCHNPGDFMWIEEPSKACVKNSTEIFWARILLWFKIQIMFRGQLIFYPAAMPVCLVLHPKIRKCTIVIIEDNNPSIVVKSCWLCNFVCNAIFCTFIFWNLGLCAKMF